MRRTLLILAAALGLAGAGVGMATAAPGESLLVLTDDGMLSRHDVDRPLLPRSRVQVTGLGSGERLIGLDTRPANATVYALSTAGRLYTVDHGTGRATPVGAKIALTARAIGFDVDPVTDQIRVVTDSGVNLRIRPDTGELAGTDPNLFYAATDVAAGQVPEVAAAGYPGSAAGTVFYGVDSARDTLVTAGSRTGQLRTVGKLGLDVKESHGFDIKGTASAIAAVQPQGSGAALLVEIDLATGTGRPLVPLAGRPVGLTYLP